MELLQISLIFRYFFNNFLSDSLLVALGHHGTRLLPDYVQIASRLLPDCLQITSRLLPDYFRLLPDYFQIASRLRPDYFHDTSRLLPDFQFTKKIASRFPIYQNCLGSRAGVILTAAHCLCPFCSSDGPCQLLTNVCSSNVLPLVVVLIWGAASKFAELSHQARP